MKHFLLFMTLFTCSVSTLFSQEIPASERAALMDIYNNTDGASWTNNTNWNTTELESTWNGVTVTDGHVTNIRLRNNNIVGILPASITTDFPNLVQADFYGNFLTGIFPDFSAIATIATVEIFNNNYSFTDLELNFTNNATIETFNYQLQKGIDPEVSFDGVIGDDYALSMAPVPGTNVQYQWYKKRFNYFVPSDEIIDGENTSTMNLINLQDVDLDVYTCKATSASVPDLVVVRNAINITGPVSQADKDALAALYNATNGDSWTNNTNWLTEEPVATWYGVVVEGNKVTQLTLEDNNITGTLPPEIGDLTDLQYLSFYTGNNIGGTLPPEMGNLTELRVLSVENNNFTGEIPESFSNLTKLRGFWLWDNQLTGNVPEYLTTFPYLAFIDLGSNNFYGDLPDFTVLPELLYVSIGNNYFVGSDFANEFSAYVNLQYSWDNSFYYSPQRTLDMEENQTIVEGGDIVLEVDESTTRHQNLRVLQFQWYKDNVLIPGATTNPYIITNATASDSGSYHCVITDTDVPDLELVRAPINVGVTLGVPQNQIDQLTIHPIPTTSLLYITTNSKIEALYISDVLGKQIMHIQNPSNTIDVSSISKGMYLLKLQTQNQTVVKRFIKN